MTSNQVDGRPNDRRRFGDSAVGPSKIFAPRRSQHPRRRRRFCGAGVRRAVARQLSPREIAKADAVSRSRVTCDGAAQADFNVIRVRPEYQQINRHDIRVSPVSVFFRVFLWPRVVLCMCVSVYRDASVGAAARL